jgi:hypothetical protein
MLGFDASPYAAVQRYTEEDSVLAWAEEPEHSGSQLESEP